LLHQGKSISYYILSMIFLPIAIMPEKSSINLRNPLLFAGALAMGMYFGYKMRGNLRFVDGQGKLGEIMQLVKDRYVDDVNVDTVEASAIDKVLAQLDPHSVYIPPQDLAAVDDDLDGDFDGIGIEYFFQRDTLLVTSVISTGPSASAGLLSGDKMLMVNDSAIAGRKVSTETIQKLLRGIGGSKVNVTMLRGAKVLPRITITRGRVPVYSIDAAYMLEPQTGYIKVNRFSATTYQEFSDKLQELKKLGMQQLVLDLRDNPGGYLECAVSILDEFIAGKRTLVVTKGKHSSGDTYSSEKKGAFEQDKLVVLVNEGSASAAEILSGVLQDYDRATIIGRRTFGKGLVQEEYKLSTGGAIRLTIARYYIPSGRCIQKDYSKGLEAYDGDIMSRYHKGELSAAVNDSTSGRKQYKTTGGRIVYGGGGISPDVFVPLDTNKFTRELGSIFGSAVLNEVANDFLAANRQVLQKYKSAKDFSSNFEVPIDVISHLKALCSRNEISQTVFSKDSNVLMMKKRIKAMLAKSIFGADAQFLVENVDDEFVQRALVELKK
jgi:carboxyl-terminal processing protease